MILQKINLNSIDKELLPLIKELNKVGIKTLACCSGHEKIKAYIAIDMKSIAQVRITSDNTLCIDWEYSKK